MDMSNPIFGTDPMELMATPTANEGIPVEPMLMDMTQEAFGMQMASLINCILDCREMEMEKEGDGGYIMGAGGGGTGADINAILMG